MKSSGIGPLHRGSRSEAGGGRGPAQPLAAAAAARGHAAGGRAEEHHDDRSHRRGQDRDRPPAGQAHRRPFPQGRGDQYTEVGYYGRDVESMVRELVENAIGLVRRRSGTASRRRPSGARGAAVGSALRPRPASDADAEGRHASATSGRGEKMRAKLAAGELDKRRVEITVEQKAVPMMFTGMGMEQMDVDLQGDVREDHAQAHSRREMTVREARKVLFEQEARR